MSKIIAVFEYSKIRYLILKISESHIGFFKLSDGKLEKNLSRNEYNIIKKVYNSLLVNTKKSVRIKQIETNNNKYDLFFDSKTANFFWTPINGIYNDNDNKFLNFRYNHVPEVVYINKSKIEPNENNNFFRKVVKIGTKVISVSVAATIALSSLSSCTNVTKTEKTVYDVVFEAYNNASKSETYGYETTDDYEITDDYRANRYYDYEEIKRAIEGNSNITEKDKELMLSIPFVFDENHQYMDLDLIIERLKTLTITYTPPTSFSDIKHPGRYHSGSRNEIEFYITDPEDLNIAVFYHEFFHVLQDEGVSDLKELSNEFFTRETLLRLFNDSNFDKMKFLPKYCHDLIKKGEITIQDEHDLLGLILSYGSLGDGYNDQMPAYYALAEIIPADVLRKYQFNSQRINLLGDALAEIDKDPLTGEITDEQLSNAYYTIDCITEAIIDKMADAETNLNASIDGTKFFKHLDYYYKKVNGSSIATNIELMIQLDLAGMKADFKDDNLTANFLRHKNLSFDYMYEIPHSYLSNVTNLPMILYGSDYEGNNILEITPEVKEEFINFSEDNQHKRTY